MEKFTKIEIGWIINLLEREAENLREGLDCSGVPAPFVKLQLEKYESLTNRFRKTLDTNSKRIEVVI